MVVRKLLHLRDKKKDDHTAIDVVEDDFDNTECDTEGFVLVHSSNFRFRFLVLIILATIVIILVLTELCVWPRESKFEDNKGESVVIDPNGNV